MNEADKFLMGGGIKGVAFPKEEFGKEFGGPIVSEPVVRQRTNFDTGKPEFYDDGKQKMQLVVHVQTPLRDPEDPEDDGVRAFYIKDQMKDAVRDALLAAGAKGVALGGELYIKCTHEVPNKRGRGYPQKIYAARYVKPNGAAFLAEPEPAPAQAMPPATVPADVLAGLTPLQRQAIAAAEQQNGTPPF